MLEDFRDGYVSRRGVKKTPLDQKVVVRIREQERQELMRIIQEINKRGEKISISRYVRNCALGNISIFEWRDIAEKALEEMLYAKEHKSELRARSRELLRGIENADSLDEITSLERELNDVERKLGRLTASPSYRKKRLEGYVTLHEADVIYWRAERLCITASDYLRFMVFGLAPDSIADSHMSFEARQRFYLAILDICSNGWGQEPVADVQAKYQEVVSENNRLRAELARLKASL